VKLRIESIKLHEVGPFTESTIHFAKREDAGAEVHILTGPNGSGKSTVLAALSLPFVPVAVAVRDISPRIKTPLGQVGIETNYGFIRFEPGNKIVGVAHQFSASQLSIFYPQNMSLPLLAYFIGLQSNYVANSPILALSFSGHRLIGAGNLTSVGESKVAESLISSASFTQHDPALLVQWIANTKAKAALARADGEAATEYEAALDVVKHSLSEIIGKPVDFKIQRDPLAVQLLIGSEVVPLDGLPDGLKAMIALLADVLMRLDKTPWAADITGPLTSRPMILLLDEIDIHLHPKWQRKILPVLQKTFNNAQIFVSTHSPFVVGSVEDAFVYRLDPPASDIHAVPSGAGQSYMTILASIFDVNEQFDPETESLFLRFYAERSRAIKGESDSDFQTLAIALSQRGEEVQDIVSRELAQVKRLRANAKAAA
jgi:predicted ATP-binding protein involved in virulence